MEEVLLIIEDQVFEVRKQLLCEHSDYFRAMFSGSYVENEQNEIKIDVIDAKSMRIIKQYMEIGLVDLSEYCLSDINDLAMAANFLQITELIKQIEYTLEMQLAASNWVETMTIAENASYSKLEQLAASFGLFSFNNMKPKYITSIQKLFWYLSHPYLDTQSELDVFKFGFHWISQTETGADAVMIVLGCLDVKRLTHTDLVEMQNMMSDFENSLGAKVIGCLIELLSLGTKGITIGNISKNKFCLCERFTERVYNEIVNLVRESKSRELRLMSTVPMWMMKDSKPELAPHFLYTFSEENGLTPWLEIANKNLWGFSITSWGRTRLIMVCGEYGRGTGSFMRDVKVYDTLKKEWVHHGVKLPTRRHAGLAVIGDLLYIVGGVGGFRIVLDTAIVYDLRQRTFRQIATLPDTLPLSPAVCSHEGDIYAAGHNNIYKYENLGESDRWVRIAGTNIRMSCMVSYKGSIYACTQNYFSYLYVFKPNINERLEMITSFTNPPAAICNLGDRLLFFSRSMCSHTDILNSVEEFMDNSEDKKPKVIWSQSGTNMRVNDVAGSCSLAMNIPPLCKEVSRYHNKYLARYID